MEMQASNKINASYRIPSGTFLYSIIGICFLTTLIFRLLLVFFPTADSGGSENSVLYFTQRILSGEPVYTDPSHPVFAIAQYTPLYYYLTAWLSRIFSIDPFDVYHLFVMNRILALVLDFGSCLLVMSIVKKIFHMPARQAWLAGIIAFIFTLPWSRIDNLCLLLWLASVYFFLRSVQPPNKLFHLLLAFFFSFLTLLSKQSGISSLLFISAYLIITRQYKRVFLCWLSFALLIGLATLILSFSSDLDNLYKNIVLGINNGISLKNYYSVIIPFYVNDGLPWLVCFVLASILLMQESSGMYRLLGWLLVFEFALSNFFALKIGAWINYFSQWMFLVVIAMAVYYRKWGQLFLIIRRGAATAVLCLLTMAKVFPYFRPMVWYGSPSNFKAAMHHFEEEKDLASYLQSKLRPGKEYVMTNIANPNTYLMNFLPHQLLFPQSDVTNTLYNRNVYDFSLFRNLANHHQIRYLISNKPVESFSFNDVHFEPLEKDTVISNFFIYALK